MNLTQKEIETRLNEAGQWIAKAAPLPEKEIRNGDIILTRHPTLPSDLVIGLKVPKGMRTFTMKGSMVQQSVLALNKQSEDYGFYLLGHIPEWKVIKHEELFNFVETLVKDSLTQDSLEVIYYDEDITVGDVFLHGDWSTNLCLHVLSGISDNSARINSIPFRGNLTFPFMRIRQPIQLLKDFFPRPPQKQ